MPSSFSEKRGAPPPQAGGSQGPRGSGVPSRACAASGGGTGRCPVAVAAAPRGKPRCHGACVRVTGQVVRSSGRGRSTRPRTVFVRLSLRPRHRAVRAAAAFTRETPCPCSRHPGPTRRPDGGPGVWGRPTPPPCWRRPRPLLPRAEGRGSGLGPGMGAQRLETPGGAVAVNSHTATERDLLTSHQVTRGQGTAKRRLLGEVPGRL